MTSSVDLQKLAIDRSDTDQSGIRTSRHLLTRYILPLLLVVGIMSLIVWTSREIVFPPRTVKVMPVISTTADIQREGAPLFQAAGWIEPRPTPVRVPALAPGVIQKLLVVEDQCVQAGEPVAELISEDARLVYESSLADFKIKEAELEEAKSNLKAAENQLRQPVHLEATFREAEFLLAKTETELKNLPFKLKRSMAEYEVAQKDFQRKTSLKDVVAGIKIDEAKRRLDSAKALVQELQEREKSLKQEQSALAARRDALKTKLHLLTDETKAMETASARVKAAKGHIEQARIAVAKSKLQFDRMTVRSPIDGRVHHLIAHPGARIGGELAQVSKHDGSTVITMYRPDSLQVRVDVRFEDIPKVSLNQSVKIDNPALKSPLAGKVLFVSSEADIQKNTLQVKVAISDPPPVLKPEMLMEVTFLASRKLDHVDEPVQEVKLYIPRQLVQQGEDRSFVWLADQSKGVARKTQVQIEANGAGGLVEIKSGLNVTSRLIVAGSDGLQDGQRIRVSGEDNSLNSSLMHHQLAE